MRNNFVTRVRIIALGILVIALFLMVRLFGLEVIHGADYRDRAESQYSYGAVADFNRNSIFFTDKDGTQIGAATLASGFIIAIKPSEIVDAEKTFETLSSFTTIDRDAFMASAAKKDDPYEEVAHRVPEDVGVKITDAAIMGVHLYPERWRIYPGGTTAAQVVGFMGYGTGDTLVGQYGLERFYNDVLTKSSGGLYSNFFAEIFGDVTSFTKGEASGDVVTSIEPSVQSFLEDLLKRYDAEWHPEAAGAIIMDPSTGVIVAMAARPTFDPNDITHADPNALADPLVERVYEFGSIMKPITMAAGLDAGVVTPASTYNDHGFAIYDGSRIANYDGKARGPGTTMQEVLNQSLNTGAAYVAIDRLGTAAFRDYFKKFGLAEETGIDLPGEATPLVKNMESPRSIEYATASFGQGFAVTPVAMARALAVLANHGIVPAPHIATSIEYDNGITKNLGWTPERHAISADASETVTRMLVQVVDKALRDGKVKIPELSVAAKTGTAQIARPDARGYYTDRYLHSFFGYFPAYEPRFIVFLYAVAPQGAKYASETWTDPFMESVRFLMTYYRIAPDRAPAAP